MSNNENMTIGKLKEILEAIPKEKDDYPVVIPVIDQDDCNTIYGFRYVRTAGILHDESGIEDDTVFTLNGSAYGVNIATQARNHCSELVCEELLF